VFLSNCLAYGLFYAKMSTSGSRVWITGLIIFSYRFFYSLVFIMAKFHYSDRTGPDRTRPDEYFRLSDQVSDMSSSTSETLSLTKSEAFVT